MLSSVLPFTVSTLPFVDIGGHSIDRMFLFQPEMAATVTDYCTKHSNDVSNNTMELWDWTCDVFEDADKMSSPLQGATMEFLAEWQQPKRGWWNIQV